MGKGRKRSLAEQQAEVAEDGPAEPSAEPAPKQRKVIGPPRQARWTNKQRTLVFSSRGISYRARHLMDDLRALMPHSKKDAKMDRKDKLHDIVPEVG